MRACSRPSWYLCAGLKAKIAKSIRQGLKEAAEKALVAMQDQQGINGWVKTHPYQPDVDSAAFAARLKPCPCYKTLRICWQDELFRSL